MPLGMLTGSVARSHRRELLAAPRRQTVCRRAHKPRRGLSRSCLSPGSGPSCRRRAAVRRPGLVPGVHRGLPLPHIEIGGGGHRPLGSADGRSQTVRNARAISAQSTGMTWHNGFALSASSVTRRIESRIESFAAISRSCCRLPVSWSGDICHTACPGKLPGAAPISLASFQWIRARKSRGQTVFREVVLWGFDLTCLPPSALSLSSVLRVNSPVQKSGYLNFNAF